MLGPEIFRCPVCSAHIRAERERLVCESCRAIYSMVGGIPDFRVNLPHWLDIEDDRRNAAHLLSLAERLSARELTMEVFRRRGWSEDVVRRRTSLAFALSARLDRELDEWLRVATCGDLPFLDLGCGSGPLLAAAAAKGRAAVGIDVSLEWLVVAQKQIRERGGRPLLAAALGESLPFADASLGGAVSLDVIEHVDDQCRYLREISRVLVPGAAVALSTPNRYSLSAEPHVAVWGVGWLPRRWQKRYVRWRTGKPYDFVRLLSVREFRRMLRDAAGLDVCILIPPIPATDVAQFRPVKALCARLYNAMVSLRPIRALLVSICPFFRVVAHKHAA